MKVVATDEHMIHTDAIKMLESAGAKVKFLSGELLKGDNKKRLAEADALLTKFSTRVDENLLKEAGKLKYVLICGTGTDNVDEEACKKRGIRVYNAPGSNSNSAAEHTIALMFSVLRNITEADRSVRKGEWSRERFISYELDGKTIGIIGFGAIGKKVVRKLQGFDVSFLVYDPFLSKEDVERCEEIGVVHIKKVEKLDDIFVLSHIITLHLPLTDKTRHMIGERQIERMKDKAIIINTSRGGVIDQKALARALKEKRIYGAGLDVFEEEPPKDKGLLSLPNTTLTPHIASLSEKSFRAMSVMAVQSFLKDIGKL